MRRGRRGAGAPGNIGVIRRFRDQLFAEHLGVSVESFSEECVRRGSLAGAVAALRSPHRTLRALDALPPSDVVARAAAIADLEQPVSLDRLVDEFAPEEGPRSTSRWALVLGVAGLTALWRLTPLTEHVTAERVTEWTESFAGAWWAPLALILAYTPAMVVMFPRPLLTLAAVVAFGPWLGFGYAMTGVLLAAVLAYSAGRLVSRHTVRRLAGGRLNQLSKVLRRRGILTIAAVRLVPVAPFVVVGLIAGAIRIHPWQYVGGTFLGMLPGMLGATVFGDQLQTALRDPTEINYEILVAVVLAVIVLTLCVRRWLAAPRK